MSGGDERESALKGKIVDASQLLQAAESELDLAVRELRPVIVGDKSLGTDALERSFEKLKAARKVVSDLEALLLVETARPPR